jgi:phosphoethanolamine N-methyltransferase
VTTREFSPETFDVVYTRDTLLHIADKPALFKKFLVGNLLQAIKPFLCNMILVFLQMWLKPGGRLMITDYCCGTDPWTDEFTKYVHQRGYHLMDVQTYGKV